MMSSIQDKTYEIVDIKGECLVSKNPTINFDLNNNRVNGFTGCNSYSAPLEIKNSVLNFGMARVTKRYCVETMKVERNFLLSLGEITSYRFEGDELDLVDKKGEVVMKAKKQTIE